MTTTAPAPAEPARGRRGLVSGKLQTAILVFCLLGLADATYLTIVHYFHLKPVCALHGGCETVQASAYSKVAGVPVALLGLIGYVVITGATLIRGELALAAAFGTALIGFCFSMYLTYRELFTIHAICQWCVGSAVFMTVLVVLTGLRFIRAE